MQFDIRSFLESGRKPFEAHFEADFSKADFGGYSVNTPAVCDFTATLTEDGAEELAYQELIFEVPAVLLCSADCQGLCPICGKKKAAGCSCQPADNAAPADARLSILKELLS